jgi:hypothetical protein
MCVCVKIRVKAGHVCVCENYSESRTCVYVKIRVKAGTRTCVCKN